MSDYRNMPIETLTEQQIKSRIHLANDYLRALEEDRQDTVRMIAALVGEVTKRNTPTPATASVEYPESKYMKITPESIKSVNVGDKIVWKSVSAFDEISKDIPYEVVKLWEDGTTAQLSFDDSERGFDVAPELWSEDGDDIVECYKVLQEDED